MYGFCSGINFKYADAFAGMYIVYFCDTYNLFSSSMIITCTLHCTENSKQIFPEIKLRGLFPVYVSVSDLYILTIGTPIFAAFRLRTDRENI
jgi:hypothetical protein